MNVIKFLALSLPIFLVFSFYTWTRSNGSSMQAAVLRGVTQVKVALATMPKPSVSLPVKFDKQDHRLSCEVAILKMALAYRGVKVDEKELIEKVGFDQTTRTVKDDEITWGDPQKAFVGNIDGKMMVDGYGVYWYPIGKVANKYRHTYVFEGWDSGDIAEELNEKNPVIIWGYLGNGKPTEWKTAEGRMVKAVYYEHTFLVYGYSGDAKNPTGFYVIDPIYGRRYYPKDAFLKMWNALGSSGVIVY